MSWRTPRSASSGTTKPKPAGLVFKRPTTRSILSGRPKRLPRICTSCPDWASDFNCRVNEVRSSRGMWRSCASSLPVAGWCTRSRIRVRMSSLVKNHNLQVAHVGVGWAGAHQIAEAIEERVGVVVVEIRIRIGDARHPRARERRRVDNGAGRVRRAVDAIGADARRSDAATEARAPLRKGKRELLV